jgi:hypothetical protein
MHADSSVIRPSTAGNPWSPINRVTASMRLFSTSRFEYSAADLNVA